MIQQIDTWLKGDNYDLEHNESHRPFWRTFLNRIIETDLSQKTILDYGCSCGGFLRYTYTVRPFKAGIGIDIAHKPIQIARELIGNLPLTYYVLGEEKKLDSTIDIAFSNEVIFLIPDLQEHARYIKKILKPHGIYYVVTGCHTDLKLWDKWRSMLEHESNIMPQNYSFDDYVKAFQFEGFSSSAKRLCHQDFVSLDTGREYFPKITDMLDYYEKDLTIFQFQKN